MALSSDIEPTRLRALEPINRLETADQSDLIEHGAVVELAPGELLYKEGDVDNLASYLLEGSVQILWNGKQVKLIDSRDKAAMQALDSSGRKRFSVKANSDIKVLRISRSQLEEKLRRIDVSEKLSGMHISERADARWPSWKLRVLRSTMLRPLSMTQIQEIIRQMERVAVTAGEVVVRQGEPGDAYYIIDEGECTVYRHAPQGVDEVHVADLGKGDAFGEESLISLRPRNATVTMASDGFLLKLPAETFRQLIHKPMVRLLTWEQCGRLITQGARWVDVRPPNKFASGSLPHALNLPLTLLRLDHQRLSAKHKYVVCGDDMARCEVATLLLMQRGVDAVCLDTLIEQYLTPPPIPDPVMLTREHVQITSQTESPQLEEQFMSDDSRVDPISEAKAKEDALAEIDSQEPIPRDLYDDTYVGKSLADLIDQMHTRHHELLEDTGLGAGTGVSEIDLDTFEHEVEQTLPAPDENDLALSLADDIPRSGGGDEISHLMGQMERFLRQIVDKRIAEERVAVKAQYTERISKVKRSAVEEVKRQAQFYRSKFQSEHVEKAQRLKAQYKKLMDLAHRISRQKAELKRARKEMENKLQATTRLQHEIDLLRDSLTQSIGNFDSLDSDAELTDSPEVKEIGLD